MTDDKIEEKLKNLSPSELSQLLEKLAKSDNLTHDQRQKILEVQAPLSEEIKRENEAAENLLRETGPQMLDLIHKSLKEDSLTTEERQQLEKTASMLAGHQMSFWLPTTLLRKVLMVLLLVIGIIGAFQWSPWFILLTLFGCSFSPRVVGEIAFFIGRLSK